MSDHRPDPEAVLARIQEDDARGRRGHFKVFFGACAGVGKTFAMLEAARRKKAEGVDVVAGWVETHGRAETAALLDGMEILPARSLDYRGTSLLEFDLDAALRRRPALLLLDELAHTNAPGSRHAKRFQDAEELLAAGIDVWTTLNVQHLGSLSDVVARITEVPIREIVPDRLLDDADEVELVDLPAEELLTRLREGKVYLPEGARRAARGFFRKGNVIALRELALRRTAERVDEDVRDYRRAHAIERTWPVTERILVCIRPNPDSGRLVQAGRRLAARLQAEWIVAHVEAPSQPALSEAERRVLAAAFKLAEDLGGQTALLTGDTVGHALLTYARSGNVSKIVVGKPSRPRWRERLFGSPIEAIVRQSGEIDVYVMSGAEEPALERPAGPRPREKGRAAAHAWAAAVVLPCTLLCWAMFERFDRSNLIMVYLLGVAFVATRFGRWPAVTAASLSVAAFDFFFVPPHMTFAVDDTEYLVTLVVMLAVGLLIGTLAWRLRRQADAAGEREHRSQVLYAMSRELAGLRKIEGIRRAVSRHVSELFHGPAVVLLPDAQGALSAGSQASETAWLDTRELAVAEWAYKNNRTAGRGTDTLPGASALYVPLAGSHGVLGVVGVRTEPTESLSPDRADLLDTLVRLAAAAVERVRLAAERQQARLAAEREQLRSTLLSSVSHDLRTPLGAITGAASSLMGDATLSETVRTELAQTIYEEADRLNRLVANLLDMTRLESGAVRPAREWHSLEEIVGTAVRRMEFGLAGRGIETSLPRDLPLLLLDAVLIEQLLVNLLDNAAKYTPPGSTIRIAAERREDGVRVEVTDDGPGLPPGEEQRVFEKFFRRSGSRGGFGLGLAICRAVVEAHGGRIWAESGRPRGAMFCFTLPSGEAPPGPPADVTDERPARA
jgi:two-component system sensor histidine kinase KdpD